MGYEFLKVLQTKLDQLETEILNSHFHLQNNGYDPVLLLTGFNNHRRKAIIELFEWLAVHSTGSYGLLYVQDDEDWQRGHDENFRVWRLALGQLTEHADPFLSPRIPIVETPVDEHNQ